VRIMLDVARGDPRVKVVRAAVRLDNSASRALLDQFGFLKVGEQWDDVDGLEDVLELSVS
jgi:RimJ/RimL family protein N-acetyltransferase